MKVVREFKKKNHCYDLEKETCSFVKYFILFAQQYEKKIAKIKQTVINPVYSNGGF